MNRCLAGTTQRSNGLTTRPGVAVLTAIFLANSSYSAEQHPSTTYRSADSHMSEELRASVRTVAVRPSSILPTLTVGGDYGKIVPTPGEGAAAGVSGSMGGVGEVLGEDPRAILMAPIIIPVAMIAGAIGGAGAAKVQQQVQEFRDGLTEEMTRNGAQSLPADTLARNIQSYLEKLPAVESSLLAADDLPPWDVNAILDIQVTELSVMVTGSKATIQTTVVARLNRISDGAVIHHRSYSFGEEDSLRDWSANDNARWTAFIDQARHRITRQICSDFFDGIILRHVLRPTRNGEGVKRGHWNKSVKTRTPGLAWELFLLGGDAYGPATDQIDSANATYDLEIYHERRLVYAVDNISGSSHTLQEPLDKCRTYSWTVRPRYQVDGKSRVGEWMRSGYPGFWAGFPQITVRC